MLCKASTAPFAVVATAPLLQRTNLASLSTTAMRETVSAILPAEHGSIKQESIPTHRTFIDTCAIPSPSTCWQTRVHVDRREITRLCAASSDEQAQYSQI
jgi:hypothetical protein